MPISSFYGMQTSLRGLIAQQRMLDTTGHNIANASTGRLLAPGGAAARPRSAQQIQVSGSADVDRRPPRLRRRRPGLPPRPRPVPGRAVPRPEHEPQRLEGARRGPRHRRALARRAGRHRHQRPARRSSGTSWSDLSKSPGRPGRQAGARPAGRRADRLDPLRPLADGRRAGSGATASTTQIAGPGGEVDQDRDRARRPEQDDRAVRHQRRQPERPDGPPRPADRSALELRPGLRRAARTAARPTSPSSTARPGPSTRSSTDQTADWAGPPAGGWSPGGQMGGLLAIGKCRRHDRRLPRRDRPLRRTRSPPRSTTRTAAPSSPPAPRGRHDRRLGPDPGRAGEHHLRHRRDRLQRPRAGRLAAARQRGHRRRLQGLRRQGRRRPQRGHAHAGQRPGARRLRRGPPPERGGRLDGRGDVQPRALPARLPGLRARHVDDGRDAGRPHQPHRKGRVCSTMRITTSMVQRNVLSDLNTLQSALAKTQSKAASSKEITRPSDDPFKAAQAMGLRSSIGANEQYDPQHPGRPGLDGLDRVLAGLDHPVRQPCARPAARRAPRTPPTPTSRNAIAKEIDQIIQGIKETANASLRRQVHHVRHGHLDARRTCSATTTPTRATRPAWTRRSPASCARSAPA